ncbi:hypothetical protein R6Q57_009538 [Mikania cordata]
MNYCGPVSIFAYGDTNRIPASVQQGLNSTGIALNHVPAVWTRLKNKTSNVYDPITNMFNLSEEDWQLEIKSNEHAEALRSAPLAYPDLCIQLFEGSTSSGFDSWGPSSTLPHPFEDVFEQNLNDFDDIECTQMDSTLQSVSEESSGHFKQEIKKRKTKETITSQIMEVGKHIKKLATLIIENHKASNDM